MLGLDRAVVRAEDPAFDERGDPVHAGQGDVRRLVGTEHDISLMGVAERGQRSVRGRAVGSDLGARLDRGLHERHPLEPIAIGPHHRPAKPVQHRPGGLVAAQPEHPLQPKALTPCFWLVRYQAAASQTRSGVRVWSKIVPAVTVL